VYIFVVFGVNVLALIIIFVEAARQRFWCGLPVFDFSSIKCAIVAASAGGTSTAERMNSCANNVDVPWNGDSMSSKFQKTWVSFQIYAGAVKIFSSTLDGQSSPAVTQAPVRNAERPHPSFVGDHLQPESHSMSRRSTF
jgi:hypothetical protein